MYVYIYIYIYIYLYISTRTHIYTSAHTRTSTHYVLCLISVFCYNVTLAQLKGSQDFDFKFLLAIQPQQLDGPANELFNVKAVDGWFIARLKV